MIRTRQTTVGRELERLLRDGVRSGRGDAQLLERYLDARDEAAFEILVERHGPLVLSLCRRYLRDPRDVEDAFQATFLILVRKGSSLRDKSSLSSWLYGVAYRVALRARSDVLKRRSREGEPDDLAQAVAPPAHPADDSLATLDAELSRLPEKYRAPLVLCYLEGRTHEQAAAELGWPVGTVRSRMAKARAILEARLTRRGLDASACLAFLRPDYFLTSTALPAITSATTSWPATALAQGVLAAMFISQWKWIGVGTTAFGLLAATAGVGAWAVDAPAGSQDSPRTTENVQATEKKESPEPTRHARSVSPVSPVSPPAVEARLAEMERKIDQITALLQRMEERSARPPAIVSPSVPIDLPKPNLSDDLLPAAPPAFPRATPVPAPVPDRLPAPRTTAPSLPGPLPYIEDSPPLSLPSAAPVGAPPPVESTPVRATTRGRASLTPPQNDPGRPDAMTVEPSSNHDRGGVRVIEAQLFNLYDSYKRRKALHDTGEISDEAFLVPIERARILVAQLREMEDEVEYQDLSIERLRRSMIAMRDESDKISTQIEGKKISRDSKLGTQVERLRQAENKLDDELIAESRELEKMKSRLPRVRELIKWAEAHFKELKKTDG